MAFPTSPQDGDRHNEYIYVASVNSWNVFRNEVPEEVVLSYNQEDGSLDFIFEE